MPSMICPSCRHPIDYDASQVGERVACPNCGMKVRPTPPKVGAEAPPASIAPGVATQAPPVAGAGGAHVIVGWTCSGCGATNSVDAVTCARCGAPRPLAPHQSARTDGLAVASLVMGLVACVPLLPQVLAVTFGAVSLRRIHRSDHLVAGRGIALAGLLLGLAFLAMWVLIAASGTLWLNYSRGAPALLPGPGPGGADEDDTFALVAENLDRLGKALRSYTEESRRLPLSLDDLVPNFAMSRWLVYTDGEQADRPFRYVGPIDPMPTDPNVILVYTEPLVPPPARQNAWQYANPDQPPLWPEGKAPEPTQRMVLRLGWQSALIDLDEFDRQMARQQGGAAAVTRPGAARRRRSR